MRSNREPIRVEAGKFYSHALWGPMYIEAALDNGVVEGYTVAGYKHQCKPASLLGECEKPKFFLTEEEILKLAREILERSDASTDSVGLDGMYEEASRVVNNPETIEWVASLNDGPNSRVTFMMTYGKAILDRITLEVFNLMFERLGV